MRADGTKRILDLQFPFTLYQGTSRLLHNFHDHSPDRRRYMMGSESTYAGYSTPPLYPFVPCIVYLHALYVSPAPGHARAPRDECLVKMIPCGALSFGSLELGRSLAAQACPCPCTQSHMGQLPRAMSTGDMSFLRTSTFTRNRARRCSPTARHITPSESQQSLIDCLLFPFMFKCWRHPNILLIKE
jgi:hypothetical protein